MAAKGVSMAEKHKISILLDKLTVCRLDKNAEIPSWALSHSFVCITRTAEELSLIAPDALVPDHLPRDKGWRCVKVEGPLDFTLYGVLAALITPLAKKGISILAIATYDTDYFLVKETQLELAVSILEHEGYDVSYKT
jgi:uncharacterized protein